MQLLHGKVGVGKAMDMYQPPNNYCSPRGASNDRWQRTEHIQVVVGAHGTGKTTILNNIGQLILDRMDKDEGKDNSWLSEHHGFRECLRSCLSTQTPYVFTLVCPTGLLAHFISPLPNDKKLEHLLVLQTHRRCRMKMAKSL